MSKIKNDGLDQHAAEPYEQQQFGTAGMEGVKALHRHCSVSNICLCYSTVYSVVMCVVIVVNVICCLVSRWYSTVEVPGLCCYRQDAAFRHVETIYPVQGSGLVC